MRTPPISLTCECGARAEVGYGATWICPGCGRRYDTSRIPAEDVEALAAGVRRYRLLALGPPLALAAVLVPLTLLVSTGFAFLLFVGVLAHALLILPRLRTSATRSVRETTASWQLEPEPPAMP